MDLVLLLFTAFISVVAGCPAGDAVNLIFVKTPKIITQFNYLDISKLDLRSTMSSPRTGILSLIRFSPGQDKDV